MSETGSISEPVGEQDFDITIAAVSEVITQFRAEMETIDKVASKIANKTTRILRMVLGLLVVATLFLGVMIVDMASDMNRMTQHLQNMYVQFGTMSEDMQYMTQLVGQMEGNVRGIREIAGHMQLLNEDMNSMVNSVVDMNDNMVTMNGNIGLISHGTREMSHHFGRLTHTVDYMRHNVGVMSSPARILP